MLYQDTLLLRIKIKSVDKMISSAHWFNSWAFHLANLQQNLVIPQTYRMYLKMKCIDSHPRLCFSPISMEESIFSKFYKSWVDNSPFLGNVMRYLKHSFSTPNVNGCHFKIKKVKQINRNSLCKSYCVKICLILQFQKHM